ncbi:hypothetical protein EYF80_024976 [Liparis tanakae]|uniref:Uncharacterized protein n=1 Tax=Liparis tanakae TaxID=230148 RepID=A0A4Z2HGQ2_9TELE|nr:hypothetical protein EYF80_024976 [Liparis tanakae]
MTHITSVKRPLSLSVSVGMSPLPGEISVRTTGSVLDPPGSTPGPPGTPRSGSSRDGVTLESSESADAPSAPDTPPPEGSSSRLTP